MPLTRELEKQAREDIYIAIDQLIERYLSEGIDIKDLKRYLKIKKSFNIFLNDINYAGRRYFEEGEDYPNFVKKCLNKVILDKISEIDTNSLTENKIKKFDQFLNESIINIDNGEISPEYLYDGLEYSSDDKDIISSYFKTKPEYVESKNAKYCIYSVTDFQTDILKNNRVGLDVILLSDIQIGKMKQNIIKKIVSGMFSQIPEQIDYMGFRIKPHTIMDKVKLKESIEKMVSTQDVLDLVTKISKFTFVNKYGENYYIWKKIK